MPVPENDFKQKVEKAIAEFIQKEGELLEMDVNERCITHSFANYVDKAVNHIYGSNWKVDVEYNRHKRDIKTAEWEKQPRKFIPDIIVHKRQEDKNMLAIEIKKSTNKNKKAHCSDKSRLEKSQDTITRWDLNRIQEELDRQKEDNNDEKG